MRPADLGFVTPCEHCVRYWGDSGGGCHEIRSVGGRPLLLLKELPQHHLRRGSGHSATRLHCQAPANVIGNTREGCGFMQTTRVEDPERVTRKTCVDAPLVSEPRICHGMAAAPPQPNPLGDYLTLCSRAVYHLQGKAVQTLRPGSATMLRSAGDEGHPRMFRSPEEDAHANPTWLHPG